MDKNAIKKYAIWARNELIARIAQKALRYGISKESIVDAYADSIDGVLLSAVEKRQRQALIAQIEAKGFEQVVEEVAYTWFNRFCALRFMEVNGYLPSNIRVLSDEGNDFKPEILTKAIELDFESLNMETVYAFKEANKDEELYRYLLIVQCNELNKILPHMFQKLEDYTELLLPDNLLRECSVVEQLVTTIPQEDFDINQGGQVEIIGWLYQYYNQELNDFVYDGSYAKKKLGKDLIPAATTIFTPDWVVRYMVENSLGRMWVEGHPNDELKANWKYYLDEVKQEESVEAELAKIRAEYANLNPKDIKVIDPCMGSGHILVYAFDVFMQIYTSVGYTEKEAAISILENNLYGIDINERAFQLAYFAVMMKARQYHKFILKKQVQCNIHSIVESNGINVEQLHFFGVQLDEFSKNAAINQMQGLIAQMHDAKEYGSIITVENYDWELLRQFAETFDASSGFDLFNANGIEETQQRLKEIVIVGEVLAKKYEVIITNPPYLGSSRFNDKLDKLVKEYYPNEKNDLSMIMYKQAISNMSIKNGFVAFITTSSWMFLSSFEKLRKYILSNLSIDTLIDFGSELFDGKVGHNLIVSWVSRIGINNYNMRAVRLVDYCYSKRNEKENEYFNIKNHYTAQQENFSRIPGYPIAYWVSDKFMRIFEEDNMSNYASVTNGLFTCNNNLFLRYWSEVAYKDSFFGCKDKESSLNSVKKWYPYNKGGNFRKWYGNHEYVVNFNRFGSEISKYRVANGQSASFPGQNFYFKESMSWSLVTSGSFAIRYYPQGFVFDIAGSSAFPLNKDNIFHLLGLLNSPIVIYVLGILNPTLNYQAGNIRNIPIKKSIFEYPIINKLVRDCIYESKSDWDCFETSWDFKKHPLV